ncbi:MAG: FHA domain-containing protein [Bacteroidales bacterium]|jgi:hypothetical protein|nr:FHA domain-containing protein [Tenuifilaceae bacterium]
MLKVICPNCKAENEFQNRSSVPSECTYCWEPIHEGIEIDGEEDNREITGLTIIYQITQQRLNIPAADKVILGRDNFGANVFSQIHYNGKPVVSRKHCSIEFKDGNFYLLDEGSLNGTFYGVNKLNCKEFPQLIEDKSIFYIGEEAFIAQINYKESTLNKEDLKTNQDELDTKVIKFYRCNDQNCSGYESPDTFDVCPICGAYKNIIPFYE